MSEPQSPRQTLMLVALAGALVVLGLLSYFLFFRSAGARVSGTVTLESDPVPGAQVVFFAEDDTNAAPLAASTDESGAYRLADGTPAGVRTGRYRVVVIRETTKKGTASADDALERARGEELVQNALPGVYADRNTTPLKVDVHSGTNAIDLPLKKRP